MLRVLIIDNNDSFTYNVVEVIRKLNICSINVVFLEDFSVDGINNYDAFILSPGPGLPAERKSLNEIIKTIIKQRKPLLGVCLGHQAIAEYFKVNLKQLNRIIHGESSLIDITDDVIYKKLPKQIKVGRYHSWVVDKDSMPKCLKVTSNLADGTIMSFCHEKFNVRGVQFHPESILTEFGSDILYNWLVFCARQNEN